MSKPRKNHIREERIHNEAIVDAYGPEEQALGWYYYLENKVQFPFSARCIASKVVSPLRKGETVEVLGLASEDSCARDMLVLIRWHGRNVAVPLSQLTAVDADESTVEAIGDWHYGWRRATVSESSGSVGGETYAPAWKTPMTKRQSKSQPTWAEVKTKLAAFDRTALLDLLRHLYAAHKDNQAFLHARFGLGTDVLEPYKRTIARWLWPDPFRNQDTSVSKAKQALSHYKKAVGDPAGLAELMVFYCEQAAGYCQDIGYQEEGFFDALVRMFEQALKSANTLPTNGRDNLIARLDRVREISHDFGYSVGDDMDYLLAKYFKHPG